MTLHLSVVDHAYESVIDEELEPGEKATVAVHVSEWNGSRYISEEIEAWYEPDSVQLEAGLATVVQGGVWISWVDNVDTSGTANANIRHTLERPLPGGGMGPFYVTVA